MKNNHSAGMGKTMQPAGDEGAKPSEKRKGWATAAVQWAKEPTPEVVNLLIVVSSIVFILALGFGVAAFFALTYQAAVGGKDGVESGKAIIPAVIALLAVPFLVWRLSMMQRQTTNVELKLDVDRQLALNAEKKLDIDRETQNTALFLKAVEMLGAMKEEKSVEAAFGSAAFGSTETRTVSKPNLEMRIGALLALERLATESDRDQRAIQDVICSYIRENSKKNKIDIDHELSVDPKHWPSTREDIQEAIGIIGRRKRFWKNKADRTQTLNLRGSYLVRCLLYGPDFSGAKLSDAQFCHSVLIGVNFDHAQLFRSDFRGAIFNGYSLERTFVEFADFSTASGIHENSMNNAIGNKFTKLPEGISLPDSWNNRD